MTTTIQNSPPESKQDSLPRNGRWSGFNHLLLARMKEMRREPEVIFWVFGFPLLLALGLGIAFRNKPAGATSIAIVGPGAGHILSLIQASQHASIRATVLDQASASTGLRLGKYDLIVESQPDGAVQYRYDPARPESVLSHSEVDDALQTAAGRKDSLPTSTVASTEPGSRYIDFLIPGLLGINLMNAAMWGIGFALVDMRQRKLLKRFVGTPMRRSDFLLALTGSRLVLMLIEVALMLAFGVLVFQMRVLGSPRTIMLDRRRRRSFIWRARPAYRQPRAKNRKHQRPDQSDHDAHVDLLRRILLLRALSRQASALHQSPAAHRAQRRPPRHHPARRISRRANLPPAHPAGLGRCVFPASPPLVPLDLSFRWKTRVGTAASAVQPAKPKCHSGPPFNPVWLSEFADCV